MPDELSRRRFLKFGAFCGVGAITSVYGVSSALQVEVNTYRIPVPNLPLSFNGFTIVQLTDLHHGFGIPIKRRKARLYLQGYRVVPGPDPHKLRS